MILELPKREIKQVIRLVDLLKLSLSDFGRKKYKIHCATGINHEPLQAFFEGKFKEWQEGQNNENFKCEEILSLIHLEADKWLFGGIFKVNGVEERVNEKTGRTWYKYDTTETPGVEHLTGRAVIRFEKTFRQSYLIGKNFEDQLIVHELKPKRLSMGEFPGYNRVLVSMRELRTIVSQQITSWRSALSNVGGVYVIMDRKEGKQYVGSAYGEGGIWGRWTAYVATGHGGNQELKKLLNKRGDKHAENFQFSILEVCDLNSSDEIILSRESHWKDVLMTRVFGYNRN